MITKTAEAIRFIEERHRGQRRKVSGLPYIVHCFNVYAIAKEYKHSHRQDEISAICLLHDILENTDTTREELELLFGPIVANTVYELTNDYDEVIRIGKTKYIDRKLMDLSHYALVVKLADMLANLTDSPTPAIIRRIAHHMEFLEENRVLTPAQKRIVGHIKYYLKKTNRG
ncbi:hypothetical protein FACS189421_06820 [Bacteroidia bacterium]|nr:hypothetical protein FACS189421_06820 [Bacteroidia bacterium]